MKKVLVVGETCKDIFIYGDCTRINPEAPTPVFVKKDIVKNYGMAANVRANLTTLGINTDFHTNVNQITKTRLVDEKSNYIIVRLDDETDTTPFPLNKVNELKVAQYDAVVVSDYNKGLLTEDYLEHLFMICEGNDVPTFLDTKKPIGDWASQATYIKINEKEYNNPIHQDFLSSQNIQDKLIVTLGKDGCMYKGEKFETKEVSVMDVAGAGDTFMAGLVYGVLHLNDMKYAIELANDLSRDVVSKRGVVLPDPEIIRKFYNSF